MVIEAALAHVVQNKMEGAYTRSDLFERRRLMDKGPPISNSLGEGLRRGVSTVPECDRDNGLQSHSRSRPVDHSATCRKTPMNAARIAHCAWMACEAPASEWSKVRRARSDMRRQTGRKFAYAYSPRFGSTARAE